MTQFWISFRSLTYAQRAAGLMERRGISASIARLPQKQSKKGCGYAVISRGPILPVKNLLEEHNIPWSQIFRRAESGEFFEVTP